ncbi:MULTISPECIES: hypothetical protein [unclassified Microbacterium]|uniref:hypothetical protein n=1 Tax=unclassified Microbacterium TaxID=2609290 RepID=UPI002882F95B|nr:MULTISPECIES: hypothetical protein [unclassified Microbacterium]
MGYETGDVGGSLRRWAESGGDHQVAAAVELVIRYRLADPVYPWIHRGVPGSRWVDDSVDFRTLATVARQTPGEDGLVMRLAADLGLGVEIPPAALGQVDDDRRAYLLAAIAQLPAGEWPPERQAPPAIPSDVILEVIARERRGLDRLLRDIDLDRLQDTETDGQT